LLEHSIRPLSRFMARPLSSYMTINDILESDCLEIGYTMATGCKSYRTNTLGHVDLDIIDPNLGKEVHKPYWALAEVRGVSDVVDPIVNKIASTYCSISIRLFDLLLAKDGALYAIICDSKRGEKPVKVYLKRWDGEERLLVVVNVFRLCSVVSSVCLLLEAFIQIGRFLEKISNIEKVRINTINKLRNNLSRLSISYPYSIIVGEVRWRTETRH